LKSILIIEPWVSFPVGVGIASVASCVGIGGGILWMPFLILVMHVPSDSAVLTSLVIQTVGMGSGSFAYLRQKRADVNLAFFLFLLTLPGIMTGAWLTGIMAPKHLELALGVLTLLTAFLFVSASQKYLDEGLDKVPVKKAARYSWVVAFGAVASGMLSISIGEWLIPLMRNKMLLRMRVAVATSIVTIFGTCLAGAVIHFAMAKHAETAILLYAVPGVLIGGQLGPRLLKKMNDRRLKEVFIFLLTLIGIHLIYNSY
jgi:uncharacterized membrane protein YfcA